MVIIELMTISHLDDIVKVHLDSFDGFFLTFLGEKFLRLYYQGIIQHNDAIKFIYLQNGQIKGFVVGSLNPSGFYSSLLKRDWFRFAIASIPAIFKDTKSCFRLLQALMRPNVTPNDSETAELCSIAVSPTAQGEGIGKKLVNRFLAEVKKRGGKKVYLTTDAKDNETANVFYKKMGFEVKRIITTSENRLMNEYWLNLEVNATRTAFFSPTAPCHNGSHQNHSRQAKKSKTQLRRYCRWLCRRNDPRRPQPHNSTFFTGNEY